MVTVTATKVPDFSKSFLRYITVVAALAILLSFGPKSASAQAPALPTLPKATVNLAMPTQGTSNCPTLTTGSNCIRTPRSGNATDFQNAINAAGPGDTIVLPVATYSGNFTIPATSCTGTGWVVVESANLSSLPASGNRVTPAEAASFMPVISTPNSTAAIQFAASSCRWRFIGVEVTTSDSKSGDIVYWLVGGGSGLTSLAQLPANIIIDRSYIYGGSGAGVTTAAITEGIRADMAGFGLVDSYCDQIVASGNDAQCVLSTNGSGPFLIQNNFLQSTGENIMLGGSDPSITNLVPSDATIIGNLIQKNVAAWRGAISDVKNLFECKNGQRVLIDGNVLQYTWNAGQHEALIIRSVPNSTSVPWTVCADFTITHNLIQHVPEVLVLDPITSSYGPTSAQPTQRILMQNNVSSDVNTVSWGGPGYVYQLGGLGNGTDGPIMHDVIIDHNTSFVNVTDYTAFVELDCACNTGDTVENFQLTNNVTDYGLTGIQGQGVASGTAALSAYASGYIYNDNVFATAPTGTYPSGTLWAGSLAGLGFASYSGTDPNLSGNFQLTNAKAFNAAGTDGKSVGVWDWACYNAETTAALAGTFMSGTFCGPTAQLPAPPANPQIIKVQ